MNVSFHQPDLKELDQSWHTHKRVRQEPCQHIYIRGLALVSEIKYRSNRLKDRQALLFAANNLTFNWKKIMKNVHLEIAIKKSAE